MLPLPTLRLAAADAALPSRCRCAAAAAADADSCRQRCCTGELRRDCAATANANALLLPLRCRCAAAAAADDYAALPPLPLLRCADAATAPLPPLLLLLPPMLPPAAAAMSLPFIGRH